MKVKEPETELLSARGKDGDSICSRGSMRERAANPVLESLGFPETARSCLVELRRRTLCMLDALQASTWTSLSVRLPAPHVRPCSAWRRIVAVRSYVQSTTNSPERWMKSHPPQIRICQIRAFALSC
jgi:hypothetical protein